MAVLSRGMKAVILCPYAWAMPMSRHAASSFVPDRQGRPSQAQAWVATLTERRINQQVVLAIEQQLDARTAVPLLLKACCAPKPIDGRRMARVMAFVGAHIEHNFTVADLAEVACMSPAHFARSFKATTGRCPHEFLRQIRVALAKQMLADRHLPISDIALSTGFSSQSNFSRAFRDATGITPRDYRAGA